MQSGAPLRVYLRVALSLLLVLTMTALFAGWFSWPKVDHQPQANAALDFTAAEISRNALYRRQLGLWPIVEFLTPLLVVAILAFTPARSWVTRWTDRVRWLSVSVRVAGIVALVSMIGRLSALPASWAVTVVDRRWGLSTISAWGWLRAEFVYAVETTLVIAVAAGFMAAAIRAWPRSWPFRLAWLAAGAIVLCNFFPILRGSTPEHTRELPPGSRTAAVSDLVTRTGIRHVDIVIREKSAHSAELNAYATGIGPQAKVVLYETTWRELPLPQLESVVAHELGHVRFADSLVLTVASAVGAALTILSLGLLAQRRRTSRGSLPFALVQVPALMAAALAALLITTPVTNAVNRAVERRADIYALDVTQDPVGFVTVMRTIALRDQAYLGNGSPQMWLRSHPTIAHRMALARAWAADHGVAVPGARPQAR